MKKNIYIFNKYISGLTEDITYYSKEISFFLKGLEITDYTPFINTNDISTIDYYLDEITCYSKNITSEIQELKNYISFLELQIYLIDPDLLDEYELQ
ncbi:MAG: hypothetical protein J6J60_06820 [Clostridia bacterium]|nr:hypothetical protein [Clostridia bacterium]